MKPESTHQSEDLRPEGEGTDSTSQRLLVAEASWFPVESLFTLFCRVLHVIQIRTLNGPPVGILWGLCSETRPPSPAPCGCCNRLWLLVSALCRELEEEIFQLGIRLEELKDHMDQKQQEPGRVGSDSPPDSLPASPSLHQPAGLPSPSGQAPTAAVQTLCPQVPLCPAVLDHPFLLLFIN